MSIITHHPDEDNDVGTKTNFAFNTDIWHGHLRKMYFLVVSELNQLNVQVCRFENDVQMCEYLVMLGARLCNVVSITVFKPTLNLFKVQKCLEFSFSDKNLEAFLKPFLAISCFFYTYLKIFTGEQGFEILLQNQYKFEQVYYTHKYFIIPTRL